MTNADQPAFPSMDMNQHEGVDRLELRYEGLTKREYFAAMAMQGLIIHDHSPVQNGEDAITISEICASAIGYADNILRQLETTTK